MSTLTSDPFGLKMGQGVYVQIIAFNSYGDSNPSTLGNGAIIVLIPDAPLNLVNDASVTNAFQIGLSWSEGLSNGGTVVMYYRLSYD